MQVYVTLCVRLYPTRKPANVLRQVSSSRTAPDLGSVTIKRLVSSFLCFIHSLTLLSSRGRHHKFIIRYPQTLFQQAPPNTVSNDLPQAQPPEQCSGQAERPSQCLFWRLSSHLATTTKPAKKH